jgi:hemoglobin/transferrin/lactoferrin receptor protein
MNDWKKWLSSSLLILVAALTSAQEKFRCVEEVTKMPVEGVIIFHQGTKISFTDGDGWFVLSKEISGTLSALLPDGQVCVTTTDELRRLGEFVLYPNAFSLNEIVVSSSRFQEKKRDVSRKIEQISAREIAQWNQTSTADVLAMSGQVAVQKSQLGGGSPIIRGFEANKVLLVIDGVTMNNAIYRSGHLQNSITIDPSILEKAELVFGPGTVVYGSDAMGGVMHFVTKDPKFSASERTTVHARGLTRFHSAANGFTGHVSTSISGKSWASFTAVSYSKLSDLRQGGVRSKAYPDFGKRTWYVERINDTDSIVSNPDPNLQVGSAYSQIDLLQKVKYRDKQAREHTLNLQLSTSSDVPRYDRLSQMQNGLPRFAEWYYGPQFRTLLSYNLNIVKPRAWYDKLQVLASAQWIEESRIDRRFQKTTKNHRIEQVQVYNITVDAEKRIKKQELRYGMTVGLNDVNSTAFTEDIETRVVGSLDTRYPDGGSYTAQAAAYVSHAWEINEQWILNDGVRLNWTFLQADFISKTFFDFPFSRVKQQNNALNGHVGFVYMPHEAWRFTVNGGSAFRAPNVDDLAKVFETLPGTVILPNEFLRPEYAYTTEFAASYRWKHHLRITGTAYATWIDNIITVLPSLFNGSDSILYEGSMSRIYSSQNANAGKILGAEGKVEAAFAKYWQFVGTINYTYGRVQTETGEQPLDHIPPLFGKAELTYTKRKFGAAFVSQFNGWKYLKDYSTSGEDNLPFATPDGMPSWYIFSARAQFRLNKYIQLQAACENIIDRNYRTFASNISAPGRNWIFTARFSL